MIVGAMSSNLVASKDGSALVAPNTSAKPVKKIKMITPTANPILPSVTYRDMLSGVLGVPPTAILAEEKVRAMMLERMNKSGKRDIKSISTTVKNYYDNPDATLKGLDMTGTEPAIRI